MSDALLQIRSCCQAFPKPDGEELLVLNDINLTLKEGEIVGLLGRSGSGKSTLLRLISGLARPVSGSVVYQGQPITGPASGIAMVFQTFALFPWLTVLENVQLGLEALGLPEAQAAITQLTQSKAYKHAIVTQVVPLKAFYAAEDYHQDYLAHHLAQPYIVYNDLPKVENLKTGYPELYRP